MKFKKGSPEAKAHMARLRSMVGKSRPTRTNPPAFFIIDPKTNKILSIVRGHPAKTFKKSVEVATAHASRLSRNVVHVVHPYIPTSFKVGTEVTPIFYGYGANEVDWQGNVYKTNPLNEKEHREIVAASKHDGTMSRRYEEMGDKFNAGQYAGRANRGREIAHNYSPRTNPGKHRFHEVPGPAAGRPAFNTKCMACGKPLMLGRDRVHADLNGPSFKAYYCSACKASAETKNPPGRSRSEKAIDKEIESAYYRHASGTQISVLDIPKLFRDVRAELASGQNIDESVIRAIARYRVGDEPKKNPAVLIRTPAKLEAERIASWISREGVLARVAPAGGEWGVFVPRHQEAAGKKTLGRVLSKNPSLSVRCNPGVCKNPGHRHGRRNPTDVLGKDFTAGFVIWHTTSRAEAHNALRILRSNSIDANMEAVPSDPKKFGGWIYKIHVEPPADYVERMILEGVLNRISKESIYGQMSGQWKSLPKMRPSKAARGTMRKNPYSIVKRFQKGARGKAAAERYLIENLVELSVKYYDLCVSSVPGEGVWAIMAHINREYLKNPLLQMVTLANPGSGSIAFDVYLNGKNIDTVFYSASAKVDIDEVKRSLVGHDGYDPRIVVRRRRKNPLNRAEAAWLVRSGKRDIDQMGATYSGAKLTKAGKAFMAGRGAGKAVAAKLFGPERATAAAERVMGRGYKRMSALKNPGPVSVPFRHGQIITVDQALAYARKSGNASLTKQLQESIALCKKANGKPLKVRFDLIAMGDPKKIDAVMAGVEYGQTDETVYKPPAGSKKGKHLFKHDWGEGTGKRKPVPLIATPGGKALVMPLRSGQKASDWLRG